VTMIEFEILKGLPAEGAPAVAFPRESAAAYREGLVVRFGVGETSWVGNFLGGGSGFDGVEAMPDGKHLLVIARGNGYVIDPESRSLVEEIGGYICGVVSEPNRNLLILDEGTHLRAIGPEGTAWISERVAWGELRNVRLEGDRIVGEAYEGEWFPFTVDVDSGAVQGREEPAAQTPSGEPPRKFAVTRAKALLMMFVPIAIGSSLVWIWAIVSLVRGVLRADGEMTCGGIMGVGVLLPLVVFFWWNVRSTWRDWQIYKRSLM